MANGTLMRREIGMPGVFAPVNAAVVNGNVTAKLGSARGFEGMAINPAARPVGRVHRLWLPAAEGLCALQAARPGVAARQWCAGYLAGDAPAGPGAPAGGRGG